MSRDIIQRAGVGGDTQGVREWAGEPSFAEVPRRVRGHRTPQPLLRAPRSPPLLVFMGVREMPNVGERGSASWACVALPSCSLAGRLGWGELSTCQDNGVRGLTLLTPSQVPTRIAKTLRLGPPPCRLRMQKNKGLRVRGGEPLREARGLAGSSPLPPPYLDGSALDAGAG